MIEQPAIFMWAGGLLYVGPGQDTDEHAHHAHQITIAIQGAARFQFPGHAPLADSVLIPALCRHRQRAGSACLASLYLDPRGSALVASIGQGPRALPRGASPSFQGATRWTVATARATASQLVASIRGGDPTSRRRHDRRVDHVIRAIRQDVARPVTTAAFASMLGVSVSRFTHVFSESVGMPFRSYILWLRLQAALDSLVTRRSLTRAAHDAGFADAAHLSRIFRRMFGIAPSVALADVRFVRDHDR